MTLFYVQIALFVSAVVWFAIKRIDFAYATIFLLPFQSMGVLWIYNVTLLVIPFQISMLGLIFFGGRHVRKLRKNMVTAVIIMFMPFLISYIYNIFFFTPIEVWEVEASRRGSGITETRESLTLTNVTQLVYVIFAFIIFLVFSSAQLNKQRLKQVVHWLLWGVNVICFIQLVTFYGGDYSIFEILFYPLKSVVSISLHEQTIYETVKRISGPFIEPSYFGFFTFYMMLFYLLVFGFKALMSSWAMRVFVVFLLLSTSGTAYAGFIVNVGIMYIYFANAKNKIYFYLIFIILSPILIYLIGDSVVGYINEKNTSTTSRSFYSWDIAIQAFLKSPIIGHAYGTTRSFFIGTQLLTSIGVFGTIMFMYGLMSTLKTKSSKVYLLGVLALGMANFEFTRPEMWLFFGLVCNPYLRYDGTSALLRR